MPTVSGALKFDSARTNAFSATLPGLANVAIVLQNTATNVILAVYTDANGNYTFNNVPNGNYQIVEAYGTTPAVATPGDFNTAAVGPPAVAAFPPISSAPNPPAGATNLDSITRTTLLVTVAGANLTSQNFMNGPVKYTPISTILDSGVIVSPINLIDKADQGTFGTFPAGTVANTGASPNPYPDIGTGFVYVLPNPLVVTPNDGQYTLQNIMNNSHSNTAGTWWRIADHTTGNETGRMMVVNGYNPGAIIFLDTVSVDPNTYYLFSSWILNLGKQANLTDPQLGVEILDSAGNILYSATLGALIPKNFNEPEWLQIGTALYSQDNTSLTVLFISMGPAATGNDYAIDDIALQKVDIPLFVPVKTADATAITVGDIVNYTVTLENPGTNPLTDVTFSDVLPAGLTFVPGSLVVNGTPDPTDDPNVGFSAPDIPGSGTLTVTFSATADSIPAVNPVSNNAQINYSYSPVLGGIPDKFSTVSNDVVVRIINADISVAKTADTSTVNAGDEITYTLTVSNNGPDTAVSPLVTDNLPPELKNPMFSLDGGVTFQPVTGALTLPDLAPGQSVQILVTGIVNTFASGILSNNASVFSPTADPDLSNNTAALDIPIEKSADISVVKTGSPAQATAGGLVTYTLVVSNAGPSDAQNVILTDGLPAGLAGAQVSTDGGVTFQPWTGSYTIGTMASPDVVTLLIRGTVTSGSGGSITNTSTVSSDTPDPDLSNNTSTAVILVNESADLAITKTGASSPVPVGGTLTYTITAVNNGPSDAQNVQITDAIPSGISGGHYSTDGGATFQPWTGSYGVGTLAHDASLILLIEGTVTPGTSGVLTNTATISSTTPDPDLTNNSDTTITPIGTSADLAVSKVGTPDVVNHGQLLTYTVAVTNLGPDAAQNAVLTDVLPSDLTGAEVSVDGGVTFQPWTGSYTIGTIPAGLMIPILIRGTVGPEASGTLTNTVAVSSDTPDPDPTNNTDSVITSVGSAADLAITKSGDSTPAVAGRVLTYTLTITNNGPDDALDTLIMDDLPVAMTSVQVSTDGGATWNSWNGSYTLGTLAANASFTLLVRGTVTSSAAENLVNTATVSSSTPDPDLSDNSVTLITPISQSADMAVSKIGDPNPIIAGNMLTYTLLVTNNGPSDAQNVVLIDAIPAGILTPEFSVDGGAAFQPWSSPYTIGTVASGTSVTVIIRGTLSPAADGNGARISNTATVSSTTPDPDLSNNSDTSVTPVEASADMAVSKSASPSPATAGQLLTYTVRVFNNGPSFAQDVILTDAVLAGLSGVNYSTDSGLTWNDWTGNVSIGTMASGASLTLLIRATVNSSDTGSITNTAEVSSSTPDPDLSNNTSTAVTPVEAGADLSIVKTASPIMVTAGSTLQYTLSLANAGPSDAQNVVVTDPVPVNLTRAEYSLDGGVTFHRWTGSYPVGTLASGASFTLLIRGTVSRSATGILSNTASVNSDTPDPDPTNNTSTSVTPVNTSADLAITKFSNPNPVQAGEMLVYTITATNSGPSTAQNVEIFDTLSSELGDTQYSVDGGLTWNDWNGIYVLGMLASGASTTVFIRGTVDMSAAGNVKNTAVVISDTPDPNLNNNFSSVVTPIEGSSADVSVVKTACPNPVSPCKIITYTLVVSNAGPGEATGTILTDTLPHAICCPQYSLNDGRTWSPWNGSVSLGTLAAGSNVTVLIKGVVCECTIGRITNTAVVSSQTADPNLSNNQFTVTTRVKKCSCNTWRPKCKRWLKGILGKIF
ncbi:MAG: isopeptide-forming domain-containing fimbrial protein [Peptococcaceae bacterium]|nr:isopeptide-forming domain-containing fimbrial protein [Peptococcaceae bacterium]